MFETKAETDAKRKFEQEAKYSIAQLELLEAQREHILKELEIAKANVVEIVSPIEDIEDIASIAALPESKKDEIESLIQVAGAVINSEVDIDPNIKENLEETILENIEEMTNEAAIEAISNEVVVKESKKEEDLQDFLEENDILEANDPFSVFLRSEMGP